MCPLLPVFLGCPFLIDPSVFSNVCLVTIVNTFYVNPFFVQRNDFLAPCGHKTFFYDEAV